MEELVISEVPPARLKILVIDDHELVLDGTTGALQKQYPLAKIFMAQTAQMARILVEKYHLDLIVMDLSIPESSGMTSQIDTGIQLLTALPAVMRYTKYKNTLSTGQKMRGGVATGDRERVS